MREQHGPEHERHEMWAAMAQWLERTADTSATMMVCTYTVKAGTPYPNTNSRPMVADDFRQEFRECDPYALAVATAYLTAAEVTR